jgi:putative phage-type endonuclease
MQPKIMQDTVEWHQWRASGVGASEIAAVMGLCPYSTRHSVWSVKTGRSKGFAGNSFTEHGKALESAARARYELQTMLDLEPACATHPVYKMCLASLDGWNEELKRILEIKCPTSTKLLIEAQSGIVPVHYLSQVQYQLGVAGGDELDFFVYHSESQTDALVSVKPDIALQGLLFAAAEDFWNNYVLTDVEPALTDRDVKVVTGDPRLLKLSEALKNSKTLTKPIVDQLKADFIGLGGHTKVRCGNVLVSAVNRAGKFSYHKLTVGTAEGEL